MSVKPVKEEDYPDYEVTEDGRVIFYEVEDFPEYEVTEDGRVISYRIEDFPEYEVTEDGRVISYKRGYPYELSLRTDMKGYKDVLLCGPGKPKRLKVHRLVAAAYIPNPMNKPQVNHLDGTKDNNHVANLEWVTHEENMAHAREMGLIWNYSGPDHHRWNPDIH